MKANTNSLNTGKILVCFFALMTAVSFKGIAAAHLTMTIDNCNATSNEIQFDFMLQNDGDQPLKFNSGSFRLVHDAGIIPFGASEFSFSYVDGTTDFPAAFVTRPANYNVKYTPSTQIMQFTTSTANYTSADAILIPAGGKAMRVGRFALKIIDGNWVPGADINTAFFPSGNGALVYVNGSTKTTAMSQTFAIADGETISSSVRDAYSINNMSIARTSGTPFAQTGNYAGRPSSVSTFNISAITSCRIAGQKPATVATAAAFTAYPNPTAGKATVSFTSDKDAKYSLKVIDVLGAIVVNENISATEGYNTAELNLENAAQGVYFVSLQTEGNTSKTIQLVVE